MSFTIFISLRINNRLDFGSIHMINNLYSLFTILNIRVAYYNIVIFFDVFQANHSMLPPPSCSCIFQT